MYIENKQYHESHKCEDCRHNSICKWSDDMRVKREAVSQMPVCKGLTPIRINITCQNFERKTNKQDGVYFR